MAGILAAGPLLAGLHGLPLLNLAANRLLPGDPVYAWAFANPSIGLVSALSLAGLGALVLPPRRIGGVLASGLVLAAWAVLLLGLNAQAAHLLATQPPAARASLGSGFWIASVCLLALAGTGIGHAQRRGLGPLLVIGGLGFLIVAGQRGALDHLSLAVEYAGRQAALQDAIAEHLLLSGGAVVLAILSAITLSLWRSGQGIVGLFVSGVQVIPAVALFGGLVALVSGLLRAMPTLRDLGLSALGPWPALVGIAAYLLLPLWRGIGTALRSADPASIDAAEALGLTKLQILGQVRLPLGAPVLVGALRVAVVQSLGLATLGALIGAGGLGRIVFDGMAQFAPDLILLGAIPIVVLSLAAEWLLSAVEARCRVRWRA
ncbi:ABC transporter permease subunit [Methylobacterium sp. 77]|uniref:ABC transporter permease n=1 Tax=Methylobacterium sp. 77 TaxID=1101192 RepID=UPI00037FA4C7|nr:ABC transporter permease subunit [Methylobacterium sp. 77]